MDETTRVIAGKNDRRTIPLSKHTLQRLRKARSAAGKHWPRQRVRRRAQWPKPLQLASNVTWLGNSRFGEVRVDTGNTRYLWTQAEFCWGIFHVSPGGAITEIFDCVSDLDEALSIGLARAIEKGCRFAGPPSWMRKKGRQS